jgi:drug/metabolite transporter (DMT)-like permease
MDRGHLYLYCGLLSLGFIGVFHKLGDRLKCRPSAVNLALFFWAALIIAAILLTGGLAPRLLTMPATLYAVGAICGFLASIAILSFQAGLKYGKISTSWVIVNLSLAVPTILSIVVYREHVGAVRLAAMILIIPALLLIWKDKQIDEEREQQDARKSCGRE